MNVSHEYLLKSRQLTWESAEVIDSFFGPVAMEVKNENSKKEYTSSDGSINDSRATQRGCQHVYEESGEKLCVHLDYNKVISVRALLAPVDPNVKTKPPSRHESISFSKSDHLAAASPSERSQGDNRSAFTIRHKKFTCNGYLTRHLRTYHRDKPFSCPQCGKSFSRSKNLKTHFRVHSGVKEFSCDICHKKFAHKGNLTTHRRTHTGDKPFKCIECNVMFSRMDVLNRHMITHTGETPYQCEICERNFTQLGSLRTHLLIHSEEKPFACTYANCEKTFRRKSHLQQHVGVHTKNKPYVCPKCHKTFSWLNNCKRHTKQCSVLKTVPPDDSILKP